MKLLETYTGWVKLPPSVNAAYQWSPKSGRRFDSDEKKLWEQQAHRQLSATMPRLTEPRDKRRNKKTGKFVRNKDTNHWHIILTVCLTSYRRDIDNCAKLIIDAVAERLRLDDRYLVELHVYRGAVETAETEGVGIGLYVYE